ncbi:pectinesterase family protein [uncultured Algoriphagus sp.]|uniref:pectinesterase family protein n=1 Tax=uncultured Algoriphagus sp. TaxID=417365 RepID=UPI00259844FE|nr:pectinesterase family protein [uncultured Algoriphagus sp.]
MDSGLFFDSANQAVPAITGPGTWSFSTRDQRPNPPTTTGGATQISVALDGGGDFATLQGALDWIPANNTLPRTVLVEPGTYYETVHIGENRRFVTIVGTGGSRDDVKIFHPSPATSDSRSAGVLRVSSDDVHVRNLTLDCGVYLEQTNPAGDDYPDLPMWPGRINVLYTTADRLVCEDLRILGGQDTAYTNSGTCYFKNCEVWGSVDFIYGSALAVFDDCDIVQVRPSGGPIAAPSTDRSQDHGIVFLHSRFPRATVADGYPHDVSPSSTTFMRPWRKDGATEVINCELDTHISTKAWGEWSGREATCRARELNNTMVGGGAAPTPAQRQTAGAYWLNTVDPDYNPATDDETTDPPQDASLSIVKTGTFNDENGNGRADDGETISYTFLVTNTGNLPLTGVTVTDPLVTVNGGPIDLAVGANSGNTFTATYTIDQDDINAGKVDNTATADSNESDPATDDETTDLPQDASLSIVKTGTFNDENGNGRADDGETISYTFLVTNTGNLPLTGVTVTDPLVTVNGGPIDLAVGANSGNTFTATYTIDQDDINAGKVDNTATADSNESDPATDDETTDLPQSPNLSISKEVTGNDDVLDGQVTYDITVTNTGNVTLFDIYVEDMQVGLMEVIAELAPGESEVFPVAVTITQELIDGGCFTNTASAELREYFGQERPDQGQEIPGIGEEEYEVLLVVRDQAEACFTQTPELTILKEITAGDPYSLVGDEVEYKYTITNTGTVTLIGPFTVEDDKIGTIADPANTSSLAPGEEIVFTATYTIVEGDLVEGSVTNIATGKGFFGDDEIESDPDEATAEASFNDIIARDDDAGTFQFSINPQVATINALDNDELKGGVATPANVILTTVTPDPTGTLTVDANGVITISANPQAGDYQLTYRITEVGNPSNFDEAVITVTVEPLLGVIEVEDYCELDAPYLRWLLNPVNFQLADIAPGDDAPLTMTWYDKDGNPLIVYEDIPLEGFMLFPGADTLPGGYGSQWPGWKFENMQWIAGEFNFYQVREPGAYVIFELNPSVQVEVTYPGATEDCNPNPNPPIAEDDDMTAIPVYEFGFDNIVNVLNNDRLLDGTSPLNTTLVDITEVGQSTPGALILDPATGLVDVAPGLAPGIYTLEYRICTNPNPTNCDTAIVTVRVVSPGIMVEKSVLENDNQVDGFITYEIKVTNTGDVELFNIEVMDDLTGDMWTISSLAPQEVWSETTQLSIDQELIDGECVTNTATAIAYAEEEGEASDGQSQERRVLARDEDSVEECFDINADIALVKSAEVENEDDCFDTGDLVTYTFVVTNAGNVTLTSITLDEINFTGTGTLSDVEFVSSSMGSIEGTLMPGETATYTATYEITLADTDARFINNQALATGFFNETEVTDLSGESLDSDVETQIDLCQRPAIELLKDGIFNDENQDGFGNVGETITYIFTVSNTGNVTLSDITVTDPMVTVNGGPISLAPGESDNTTFTATYELTQQDIDNGYVVNLALAEGTSPTDEVVEDESSDPTPVENPSTECETCTETEIPQNPSINIDKTADPTSVDAAGQEVTYTLTVTNTGNTTLAGVTINDPLTGFSENVGSMVPGQVVVRETTYVVTQADIDNGSILNVADVFAFSGQTPVSDEDDAVVEAIQRPGITMDKTADPTSVDAAGQEVTYTLTVTNTGNTTLAGVTINDPLTGFSENVGSMVPGQVVVRETTYVVTQADIDNGSIVNLADVFAFSGQTPVSDEDDAVVEAIRNPSIQVIKTDNGTEVSEAGDVITYTLTVTNTGNVTLTNVTVVDPLTGLDVNVGTLAPGASTSVDTDYEVTQTDVDAGFVLNTALTTGESPEGEDDPEDETEIETPIDRSSSINISKVADVEAVQNDGEVINYTIVVTNTGNTTLTDVAVADPLTGLDEVIDVLQPGESVSFETSYTVTIADLADKQQIVNVATATFTDPVTEDEVTEEAEETVDVGCIDWTLVTGIVYNALTDQPLPNVPITLIPQGDTPGETLIVITDAEGRYVFKDVPTGNYLIQVQDANLNAQGLFNFQKSSLAFREVEVCVPVVEDFPYAPFDGVVLGDFVWYDLNQDGIQNEWFDANNDGQVTMNDLSAGPISIREWEWFDLNGDGRYDGPENEGELNKAGLAGTTDGGNIRVTGPNGYDANVIVGILGYWRERPGATEDDMFDDQGGAIYGEYDAVITADPVLLASASAMAATGLVKNLPNEGGRMTDINSIRFEERCGLTTDDTVSRTVSSDSRVHLDMDFGWVCVQAEVEIIANDDDFGDFFVSYGGLLGNILDNDLLEGQRPDPADVDFEFTELDGVIGLLIDDNGELSLIPNVNEARAYTLRYVLRETAFPDNNDDALVFFRLLNDQVDLSVEKTSFEVEIYEGDEFEYEITVRNIGGTPATNVEIVDELPASVTYLSSSVVFTNDEQIQVGTPAVTGSRITWNVPFLPADGVIVFRVRVQAGDAGTITNIVTVGAEEEDVDTTNNQDDDVNQVLPFRIPNVITPNNDGDNDSFEIKGLGKFVSNEITIFNRYGDHVLEQENYRNDWNAPGQVSGTYFFVLRTVDRSGREHEFTGWIQVIKED